MTLAHVIGIDGGGTHTRVLIAAVDGSWKSSGKAGCSNLQHAGWEGCREALEKAIEQAYAARGVPPGCARDHAVSVFLGLAGVTSEKDRSRLRELLESLGFAEPCKIGVHHDIASALAGGLAGRPGIALIAGTGSSCYGVNARGEDFRCGGWGALVDDVGGAYWIGKRALEVAVRQEDGRIPGSEIRDLVAKFLGIFSYDSFLSAVHDPRMTRDAIARLARGVEDLAVDGDIQATLIIDEAVDLLTQLVVTTMKGLDMKEASVIFAGSVANAQAIRPRLVHALSSAALSIEVVEPAFSPVCGSVIEARRLVGLSNAPASLEFLNP
jgi:glucosamine kinase